MATNIRLTLLLAIGVAALPLVAFGQIRPGPLEISPPEGKQVDKNVRVVRSELLAEDVTRKRIEEQQQRLPDVRLLIKFLDQRGFRAQPAPQSFYGVEIVRERISDKETLSSFLYTQNYLHTKKESKDSAAIGVTGCSASSRSEPYAFAIVLPNGNFEKAVEYFVENGQVVQAKSWGSCMRKNLSGAGSKCVTAAAACAPTASTLFGWFICTAGACAGAVGWEVGCCACDCRWWCRWGADCCNR
jgi:hypothetical protein